MKKIRQAKIKELIETYDVETQEDLVDRLRTAAFDVTQATISRDIREMNLTKVLISGGKQKYTMLQSQRAPVSDKFIKVFCEATVSIDNAKNILVIKTISGMAMAVAAALDAVAYKEIMGSIAGDDTIFCVVKTEEEAEKLIKKLRAFLP